MHRSDSAASCDSLAAFDKEGPPVEEFDAKAAVHHWWDSRPRVRRQGFHSHARRQAAETQEQILDVIESELPEIVQKDVDAEKAAT